ncbi:MAG: hypothetical protein AB7P03_26320 [Kofleriaceae bacterium]
MKSTVALICSVLLTHMVSGVSHAQPAAEPAAPSPPAGRHGLFATSGVWAGNISCDGMDCGGFREAGGLGLQVGYMVTPRFGVLADVWGMTSSQNDVSITFVTATLNARYWLAPVIWVQAGVGTGHARVSWGPFSGASDDVAVGAISAGIEVVRGRRWAVDVAAKLAQGSSTDVEGDQVQTGRSTGVGVSFVGFLN